MQLVRVLARQVRFADEAGLQEPDDEGPRPGEGVEHVHAFICDAAPQVGACQPVHAAQNEVHDLHRRVDDPQRLGRLGKGQGEEPLVEFGDDPLLAGRIVNARAALADRLVEALQLLGLRLQVGSIQSTRSIRPITCAPGFSAAKS